MGVWSLTLLVDNKKDYSLEIQVTLGSYTNSINAINLTQVSLRI